MLACLLVACPLSPTCAGLTPSACQPGDHHQQPPSSSSLAADGDQQHGSGSPLAFAGRGLPFCAEPAADVAAMPAAAPTLVVAAHVPPAEADAALGDCCVSSTPPALTALQAAPIASVGDAPALLQDACLVQPDGACLQHMPAAAEAGWPQQCARDAQAAVLQGGDCGAASSSSGGESDGGSKQQRSAPAAGPLLPATGSGGGAAGKKQRRRKKGKKGKKRSS